MSSNTFQVILAIYVEREWLNDQLEVTKLKT